MKKIACVVGVLLVVAAVVWAGSSGVSSTATKFLPAGSTALRDAQIAFNDDVIAELDSDEDRLDSLETFAVLVPTNAAYTVLAANSGKTHLIQDVPQDMTFSLPTEAAGLSFKFVYAGNAADAQDWIINTTSNANYYVGGLTQIDVDALYTNRITTYHPDGNSNSKLGVLTPDAGTSVELWCTAGTTWRLSGIVVSATDAGVTFADQ